MSTIKYKGESVWVLTTSNSGWSTTFGVALIITGLLALLMPIVATLASVMVFAWLLIIGGIFEIIHSVQMNKHKSFIWMFITGLFTFLLGLAIWLSPLAGIASLSVLVGVFPDNQIY